MSGCGGGNGKDGKRGKGGKEPIFFAFCSAGSGKRSQACQRGLVFTEVIGTSRCGTGAALLGFQ
jgi:hypothetical protein